MSTVKVVMTAFALATFGIACSSSSSSPDGGDAPKETGGDAPKDGPKDGGGDAPADMAPTDVPAGETADGGEVSDGPVLTPAQARGKYLVQNVIGCSDCHTPRLANGMPDMTKYMAGVAMFVPGPNGQWLGSRNLTNDITGLKNRTDAEIKDMFLNGKRPTATSSEALFPVMPYYVFHNMTDDDADAIVAFLRTIPAVTNDIPRRGAAFDLPAPANYLNLTVIPTPADTFADKASALRGRYLATQTGLCVECHTPHLMGADPLDVTKYFAGGEDFSGIVAPLKSVSKNLTSDNTTGLGMWTAADVKNVLKMGKAKDGSGICPPMPLGAYMGLTDPDATDIANYIKSLPAIVNNIVDMCVFPPVPPDGGTDATEAGTDGGTETAPETAPEAGVDADEVGG